MIRVSGVARLRVYLSVGLDMTEDEFNALSNSKVEQLLDSAIDWHEAVRGSELEDLDIDDIENIEEE